MTLLVDTTVWSLAIRRRAATLSPEELQIVLRLTELIRGGRARIIGPVRQELLSGIRNAGQFESVRARMRSFDDEAIEQDDYEEAARIHNQCRSAGIAGSPVDFLLCAVARRREWPVFTLDRDFERYAPLAGIRLVSLS